VKVTTCPCCGFKFAGDLRQGCEACGARAVGDPLPGPERVLPAYGRSLLLVVIATLMVLAFLAQLIFAFIQRPPVSFTTWSVVVTAERAAWHLKWVLIPVAFVVLWSGRRIYQSMLLAPSHFVGMRAARRGVMTSALVCLVLATLIAVTIPRRLREHEMAIDAGIMAQIYTRARALREYRARNGALPSDLRDVLNKKRLPDPDGSIAAAFADVDPAGYKLISATVAELTKGRARTLRGAVIRNAAVNTEAEATLDGLSFDYELRLPGEDKIFGTDDDWIDRDGVIMKASEVTKPTTLTTAPVRTTKP
jgi:hypothetical protein